MSEKQMKGVLIPRNDIANNWSKAVNFVPKKGEIIVYNADTETYSGTVTIDGVDYHYESSDKVRFKFGDGIHNVNVLPFVTTGSSSDPSELSEFKVKTKTHTVNATEASDGIISKTDFEPYNDDINSDNFLLFQDGVLLTPSTFYIFENGDFIFNDDLLYEGSLLTLILFSGNLITNNGGDEPGSVIVDNIEGKTLELSNTTQYEELEAKMVPKQFVYGTPAPDETGNIASGISYRISTDDDDKPGSADYKAGQSLEANAKASLAVGCNNKSNSNYSTTFGSHNNNNSYGGFVSGTYNISLGENTGHDELESQYSTMVGRNGTLCGHLAFIEGDSSKNGWKTFGSQYPFNRVTINDAPNEELYNLWETTLPQFDGNTSFSTDAFAVALGDMCHVGGLNSFGGGAYSFAFGEGVATKGRASVAFNLATKAFGANSFAIGGWTTANGTYSMAIGTETQANGTRSFAGGLRSTSAEDSAFVFGDISNVTGRCSTAFGYNNNITGEFSAILGSNNRINGNYSFATGDSNTVTGYGSAAIGYINDVQMSHSTAIGYSNSVEQGDNASDDTKFSFALGYELVASGDNQVVVGMSNAKIDNSLITDSNKKARFIVGVGSGKNGLVVYGDGHAVVGKQGTTSNSVATVGNTQKKIMTGTEEPTGGVNGDIYIQIIE